MGFSRRQKISLVLFTSEQGSALFIVISLISILALSGVLMLNQFAQSSRNIRTSGATVESNALFSSIQQAINNQTLCTQAMGGQYSFTNVGTGNSPQPVSLTHGLRATINSTPVVFASPGLDVNGISIATGSTALQLTGGGPTNYVDYGVQSNGLTMSQGYGCAQVMLHVVAAKENRTIASSGNRNTIGAATISEDFPVTIFTDPATGLIQSCYGGSAAGFCTLPSAASMTGFTPLVQCATPGNVNFSWTATNQSYVVINCSAPAVTSANLTTSPSVVNFGSVPVGSTENCVATAYNSALQPGPTTLSAVVHVQTSCSPPTITASASCVDTGNPYSVSWTDNDTDATGVETLTGPGVPGPFTPPVTPGGSTGLLTAPGAPTTLSYSISDSLMGTASTSIAVVSPPSFSTTLSVTPSSVFSGGSIVFNYATSHATSVTMTDPVTSVNIPEPLSGPITVTAPVAGGTYSYIFSLAGGCPGDPAVTASTSVTVCACVPSTQALFPTTTPSTYDSCGALNTSCPGTQPAGPVINGLCGPAMLTPTPTAPSSGLCNQGTPGAVTPFGPNWVWNCVGSGSGATTASCWVTNTSSSCYPAGYSTTTTGCPGGYNNQTAVCQNPGPCISTSNPGCCGTYSISCSANPIGTNLWDAIVTMTCN